MTLTTEFFVLIIFMFGLPFFYGLLRDSGIRAWGYFFISYLFLALSNIFTVVEDIGFYRLFNLCQHAAIAVSSAALLTAVIQFIRDTDLRARSSTSKHSKGGFP